jgi:hypothetical protein
LIRKVVSAFMFIFAQVALSQASVQDITLSFLTQKDAKPWNAQVRGKLVCEGQTMATLKCCSGDRKSDQWAVGSTHYRNMQMAQTLPQVALTGCTFRTGDERAERQSLDREPYGNRGVWEWPPGSTNFRLRDAGFEWFLHFEIVRAGSVSLK